MGKVVDAQKTPDAHRAISRDLSKFAGDAKSIVGKHQGFTIYAGGDDVMAFVPLHTLLDCAVELHAAFEAAVGEYTSDPEDGATVSPSLSVGIVIAHHLEPLSDVLALAREAEKTAKKHQGKDALAITLSKRSGADRTIVGGWKEGIAERLRFLMDNVATKVPEGAAYEILHMHRKLTPTHMRQADKGDAANLPQVIALEAIRILARKRGDRGQQEIAPKIREDLRGYMETVGAAEVANELILASLLAKARQLATGSNGAASAERKEKVNA
jgi:CRISPR-associated protein Cmr2